MNDLSEHWPHLRLQHLVFVCSISCSSLCFGLHADRHHPWRAPCIVHIKGASEVWVVWIGEIVRIVLVGVFSEAMEEMNLGFVGWMGFFDVKEVDSACTEPEGTRDHRRLGHAREQFVHLFSILAVEVVQGKDYLDI